MLNGVEPVNLNLLICKMERLAFASHLLGRHSLISGWKRGPSFLVSWLEGIRIGSPHSDLNHCRCLPKDEFDLVIYLLRNLWWLPVASRIKSEHDLLHYLTPSTSLGFSPFTPSHTLHSLVTNSGYLPTVPVDSSSYCLLTMPLSLAKSIFTFGGKNWAQHLH